MDWIHYGIDLTHLNISPENILVPSHLVYVSRAGFVNCLHEC